MKFLPKIVTLSLGLAMFCSASAAQAKALPENNEAIISTETNSSTTNTSIDPVEIALNNVTVADVADKPDFFPIGYTVKEFGNGSLIAISNEYINRDKRVSAGFGRGMYVYFTTS